ncbi:MAG: AAA family ATPase [Candidatus Woesearchaeota archaeon]
MKTIIISGTPASGKTTLGKRLAKELKFNFFDLEPILENISEGYDRKKQCLVIDIKKLNREVVKVLNGSKENLVISSHLIQHLPKKYVDLCVVTRCSDLKKLKKRLEKRGYSKKKVEENLQCEIFGICLEEARRMKYELLVVDTCQKMDYQRLAEEIRKKLAKSL